MQAPYVAETLYLIDFFVIQLLLYYFKASLRICLHPLAPIVCPIKKSAKMGIVNQRTTIPVFNLSFNIVDKAPASNKRFYQTETAFICRRNGRVRSFAKNPNVAPVQPIKTNNQNAQEVKTDFVCD